MVKLLVQRMEKAKDLPLPNYMTAGASGMDVRACVEEALTVGAGERVAVPTGLLVAVPEGHELQVRARSGLAASQGLVVLNGPGTIDQDYRGEVRVLLINLGQEAVQVERGQRVAQLVLCPVVRAEVVEVGQLPSSERGVGGFGHTGV